MPAGLGWLPDGRLLLVSVTERKLLRLDPGGLVEVADLTELAPFHCNDMVVDAQGRAYIGNYGFDVDAGAEPTSTTLVCVDPDGEAWVAIEQLLFPNGIGDHRRRATPSSWPSRSASGSRPTTIQRRRLARPTAGCGPTSDPTCPTASASTPTGAIWVADPDQRRRHAGDRGRRPGRLDPHRSRRVRLRARRRRRPHPLHLHRRLVRPGQDRRACAAAASRPPGSTSPPPPVA